MKLKTLAAPLICFFFVVLCFSQSREYPKEIRGYKVERAAVELKPRQSEKLAKSTDKSGPSSNNSTTAGTSPSPTPAATPGSDSNVDQVGSPGTELEFAL